MKHFHDDKIKKLTLTGLLTALVTVSTMAIRIPVATTGGYIHPGDALVLLSGFLLGPLYGAFAAGVGSALADLLAGYFIYVPVTFVIKGLTASVSALLFALFTQKRFFFRRGHLLISGLIAEGWMVFGYFLFESILYHPATAFAAAFPNILQGLVGVVMAAILYPVLSLYNHLG